jgi:hypothetical protein
MPEHALCRTETVAWQDGSTKSIAVQIAGAEPQSRSAGTPSRAHSAFSKELGRKFRFGGYNPAQLALCYET